MSFTKEQLEEMLKDEGNFYESGVWTKYEMEAESITKQLITCIGELEALKVDKAKHALDMLTMESEIYALGAENKALQARVDKLVGTLHQLKMSLYPYAESRNPKCLATDNIRLINEALAEISEGGEG